MSIDPLASRLASNGVAYAPEIVQAARRRGLDPNLLAAVAAQETGGPGSNSGRNVIGDGGHGHGIFQIDDRWHPFASSAAAMDPASNANYAAGMLAGLLKRYGGNVHAALSAYNSGSPTAEGTATRWTDGSELGYADSVLRHYARLTGEPAIADSPHSTAIAESPTEIASVGALGAAAQPFPMPVHPPALGQTAQRHAPPFARQSTDYASFFSSDNNDID